MDPARAGHHLERPARPAPQPRPPGRDRPVRPVQPRRGVDGRRRLPRGHPLGVRGPVRPAGAGHVRAVRGPDGGGDRRPLRRRPRPRGVRSTPAPPGRPHRRRRRRVPARRARRARSASARPTTATGRCSATGRAPDATAEALQGGELHTGDVGFLDEDGRLHVRDRKSLVILAAAPTCTPPRSSGSCSTTRPSTPARCSACPTSASASGWRPWSRRPPAPRSTSTTCAPTCWPTWPGTRCPSRSPWSTPFPATPWARSSAPSCRRCSAEPAG